MTNKPKIELAGRQLTQKSILFDHFFFKVFLDARKWAGSNVHKILKFLALDLFLRKFTGFSVNMVIWGKLISIF